MWFLPFLCLVQGNQFLVKPHFHHPIVRPDDHWLTDEAEQLLFLPLLIPKNFPVDTLKLLCNGKVILVLVTESVKAEAESDAMATFKDVMASVKHDSQLDKEGGDDRLDERLDKWAEREQDPEVRVMVQDALDHVRKISAKMNTKSVTGAVPLSALRMQAHTGVIRESFTVELPGNGINPTKVFAVQKDDDGRESIFICLPFDKSLTPAADDVAGILHPYSKIPVYPITAK